MTDDKKSPLNPSEIRALSSGDAAKEVPSLRQCLLDLSRSDALTAAWVLLAHELHPNAPSDLEAIQQAKASIKSMAAKLLAFNSEMNAALNADAERLQPYISAAGTSLFCVMDAAKHADMEWKSAEARLNEKYKLLEEQGFERSDIEPLMEDQRKGVEALKLEHQKQKRVAGCIGRFSQ